MAKIELCPECGIPEYLIHMNLWLNNGDIVKRIDQRARMAFIESENLDPLFNIITERIGASFEGMIIDMVARGVRFYLNRLIPKDIRNSIKAREMEFMPFIEGQRTMALLSGQGKWEFLDYRYENDAHDYSLHRIMNPYSVPCICGTLAGAIGAMVGGEIGVTCWEVSPDEYEMTTYWTVPPEGLKEKLPLREYHHRNGDSELRRCATCGGPASLSGFVWFLDKGIIKNVFTSRRMILLSPDLLDPIFEELEAEFGEEIPKAIVEAQRAFVKAGYYTIADIGDEGDVRTYLALRGMGNLKEMKLGANRMRMRIDNAALPLMVVGLAQGLFEMAFGVESNVQWEIFEEGDLELEVTPLTRWAATA
jgi:hypothetical protein